MMDRRNSFRENNGTVRKEDVRPMGATEKEVRWDGFLLDRERDMRRIIDGVRRQFAKTTESIQFFENKFSSLLTQLDRRSDSFRNIFWDYSQMFQEIEITLEACNVNIAAIEHSYAKVLHKTSSEYSIRSNNSSCDNSIVSLVEVESSKSSKTSQDTSINDKNYDNKLLKVSLNKNAPEFTLKHQSSNMHQLNLSNTSIKENAAVPSLLDTSISELTLIADTTAKKSDKPREDLFDLPAQEVLELGRQYPSVITWVQNPEEFYVTVDVDVLEQLFTDMTIYYKNNYLKLKSEKELESFTYWACYQSGMWFRALITAFNVDGDPKLLECYLVDIGRPKVRISYVNMQPLRPEFCKVPVLARLCHLSFVKPLDPKGAWSDEAINYLKGYVDVSSFIIVDDNETESLGVFVALNDSEMINGDIAQKGLAEYSGPDCAVTNSSKEVDSQEKEPEASDETQASDVESGQYSGNTNNHSDAGVADQETVNDTNVYQDLDEDVIPMGSTEEYYDPLMAVQGYQNRDEIDICKHYKGPPDTTCFKGKNCKKRHELMHPDGWTKDKQPVYASTIYQMCLPAVGSKINVMITFIISEISVKGQILNPPPMNTGKHSKSPSIIPQTLGNLIASMNKNTPHAEEKLQWCSVRPAIGELLAARYALDNLWYRVQVMKHGEGDDVLVSFVDYGNLTLMNYKYLRHLDVAHIALPFQAVTMNLVDVGYPEKMKQHVEIAQYKIECKQFLANMIINKKLTALVTYASESHLDIVLYDELGMPVVDSLARRFQTTKKKVVIQEHLKNEWIPG